LEMVGKVGMGYLQNPVIVSHGFLTDPSKAVSRPQKMIISH